MVPATTSTSEICERRVTTVAGPQIISISQGVHAFRIVVYNNYHIYVVVAIIFHFVQTATYLLFICVVVFFFKSKRIDIVMIDSAPVLCGLCVFHRNGL